MEKNGAYLGLILALGFLVETGQAQADFSIYSDQLDNGFQDWGWATHEYANTSPVHSGSDSVSVTIATANYDGLQIYHPDLDSTPYNSLSFWINGGPDGGQQLQVYGLLHVGSTNNAGQLHVALADLPPNNWQHITIPLSDLGVASQPNFTGFVIQSTIGAAQPTFYLDDIELIAYPPPGLVHIGVDAGHPLRTADSRWFGLNTAVWDGNFDTPSTTSALKELGTQILRFPGGSLSDEYHWATGKSGNNTWAWGTSFNNFVHIATNAGVQAMITVNYGTGTSNEAAAWVRHANVTNHLAFKYWEIGNECYGTWETDSNAVPHDPYTYAVRARDYISAMKAADPAIKIGVVAVTGESSYSNNATHFAVNPRTGTTNYGWTPILLATLKSLGVTPDFLVHHVYPEWTDKNNASASPDNDQQLLAATASWADDAADLRQQISDYFGVAGTNIELLATENNSDAGAQGRQSTSLVNGLYLADSLAQLMKTEFNGFVWWDLRNGTDTDGYFGAKVYGWRNYGDLGVINGLNTRHPVYYTFKLMQYFAQPGETILDPASDYFLLPVYSTRKADGSLALLVINKDSATTFTAQLSLTNYLPWTNALVRQYGIAQDEATRTNSIIPGAQDISTNHLAVSGTHFDATFPPYSATLLTISPAAPTLVALPPASGLFNLQVQAQANVRYILQSSSNLVAGGWTSVATNTLTNAIWNISTDLASPAKYWRAVWLPPD